MCAGCVRSLRGDAPVVRVIPYSFHPPERTQLQLRRLLADVLGEKTRVTVEPPIAYGAEDEWLARLDLGSSGDADHLLVLFNLSATPRRRIRARSSPGFAAALLRRRAARR
jgi:hypothetical protein